MGESEGLWRWGWAIGMGLLLALALPNEADAASTRDVVINEVAWMGTAASAFDEWLELHNPTDRPIDLSGWTLGSDDGSPDVPLSGTIPAGGYFVLERTDDEAVSDVAADQVYTGTLSNSGEALRLRDGSGDVIDRANQGGGDWPGGVNPSDDPDGWGTMERIDPSEPDAGDNWATNDGTARNGLDADGDPIHGTPGEANSVAELNAAPACRDVAMDVAEDEAGSIDPSCSDPDGDSLSYAIVDAPSHGSASVGNGQLQYAPDADFNGSDAFTYRADDGQADSDTATVDVTVTPVNDAPTCEAISVQVDEGTIAQITPDCADVDGDSLSYEIVEAPSHGTASLNAGKLRYQPAAGFTGSDSFTYRADDGVATSAASISAAATSNDASVSVTVTSDNDPPDASDDSATTDEDTAVTIDVLSNDSDPDGDPLTLDGVTSPSNGTASVNADDTITYDPTPNFHGSDSFGYTIRDDDGATDTATVDVTVEAVNDAPSCHDVSLATDEDTATAVAPDCADPDDDALSYEIVDAPSNGSASVADGQLQYDPDADFHGSDAFTYRAADGQAASDAATVEVTVHPVNDAPTCQPRSVGIDEDTDALVDPDCSDPEGDALAYAIAASPDHGTASIDDGRIRYQPDADFHGEDAFTYRADDGDRKSDPAEVSVTVQPVNDPPVARDQSVSTDDHTPVEVRLDAADVDGDELDFQVEAPPEHGSLSGEPPALTYTPQSGFAGTDEFTFTATDGEATSNVATVRIDVKAVSDGDVDGDDTVDVLDARICLQLARGLLNGKDVRRAACDVDGDGDVDRDDAEAIADRALNDGSDVSTASRSPSAEALAGLGLLGLGLSLALGHRRTRRARLGLISTLLVVSATLLTGCPGLIPALPTDATGIQATVSSAEIRLEVQNMPNGGLAAFQVEADGLRFDGDALDVTDVAAASNWVVLATDIDNDAGRVRLAAVKLPGGTSDGQILSLRIDPRSGFSRGAADVRWAPAHLTLGDATNAEITEFQTGTQP